MKASFRTRVPFPCLFPRFYLTWVISSPKYYYALFALRAGIIRSRNIKQLFARTVGQIYSKVSTIVTRFFPPYPILERGGGFSTPEIDGGRWLVPWRVKKKKERSDRFEAIDTSDRG